MYNYYACASSHSTGSTCVQHPVHSTGSTCVQHPAHSTGTTCVQHTPQVPLACSTQQTQGLLSTNYHVYIAMPTWCKCALPILFWPPHNLFPRSCLTLICIIDPHWGVPLCLKPLAFALFWISRIYVTGGHFELKFKDIWQVELKII